MHFRHIHSVLPRCACSSRDITGWKNMLVLYSTYAMADTDSEKVPEEGSTSTGNT